MAEKEAMTLSIDLKELDGPVSFRVAFCAEFRFSFFLYPLCGCPQDREEQANRTHTDTAAALDKIFLQL